LFIKEEKNNLTQRYRFYIDESGDHTYGEHPDHPQKRFLCLTGVILPYSMDELRFHDALRSIKEKYFKVHPDESNVILHREDIVGKRGFFFVLLDDNTCTNFNNDLLKLINDYWYIVIAVVIDKVRHQKLYGEAAFHPYHYCMSILLERYCGWMNLFGYKGDVMAESRGGVEDAKLKEAYIHLYQYGTNKKSAAFFQQSLSSREIKIRKKDKNIPGLQLADLLAHPCKQDILIDVNRIEDKRSDFVKRICEIVNGTKYNRHVTDGQTWFWGKYYLPNISSNNFK